jgi:hypothetical protein
MNYFIYSSTPISLCSRPPTLHPLVLQRHDSIQPVTLPPSAIGFSPNPFKPVPTAALLALVRGAGQSQRHRTHIEITEYE